MRRSLFALALFAALAAASAPAASAAADTLVTLTSRETRGGDGPPREGSVAIWIGEEAIARDDGRSNAILRDGELVLVDHESRSYSVLPLPADVGAMIPPEMRELAGQMMQMMRMEAEITPTDERRTIGRWQARRYQVQLTNAMGVAVAMDLWQSEEVDVPAERVKALSRALGEVQPGGGGWVAALTALPGFPVLQETRIAVGGDEVTNREELVSIERKPAPAGAYAPPAEYAETPFSPLPPMTAP